MVFHVKYIELVLVQVRLTVGPPAAALAHRVVLDGPDLADDAPTIRLARLFFFVNSQPLFLKLVEILELALALTYHQELFSMLLDSEGVFLVLLKVHILVESQPQGWEHAGVPSFFKHSAGSLGQKWLSLAEIIAADGLIVAAGCFIFPFVTHWRYFFVLRFVAAP